MSHRTLVGLIGVVMLASACSKTMAGSPTAPTISGSTISRNESPSAAPAIASASTGAQIVGAVSTELSGVAGFRALSTGLTVHIAGTSISAVIEASGHFELNDVPEGDVELQFSGPGVDAKLPLAGITAHERIDIAVTVKGSAATLENTQRAKADSTVSLDGIIASIDAPAFNMRIGDATIVASSTTSILRGSTSVPFSDLHAGDKVKVQGSRDGSVVRAGRIDAEPLATVSGTVAGLAGTCPSLTFSLDGTAVTTNASTSYGGGSACGEVKNGDKRVAIGPKVEGSVRAQYVTAAEKVSTPEPTTPPPPTTEVLITGTISSLAGACPNLTFTVDGYPAVTSASTTYGGGSACTDVKNGDKRTAAGIKSDGHLVVRYVSVRTEPAPAPTPAPTTEVTVTGIVASLAGACPSLTFAIDGYPAATSASTIYGGGITCADVKNGDKRSAVGTKTDGRLLLRYLTLAVK